MRIANTRDLGLYVRDRRRQRGESQAALAEAAHVSRRWLADLEAGKPTVAIGLVLQTLDALDLVWDVGPYEPAPDEFDLGAYIREHAGPAAGGADHEP